ncbi:MAG: hypothetical protein HQK99_17380 [Nitrospirae bacterium]|nr:hypothetical protein [Nitrospirota bacterium]MBF0463079.1 hypothetical protein [Magnetococcales bacterium]MBF0477015.1 hypothetical protein [Deltaproteobacteria bacterium]MBF0505170.1 hypothetical protein [Candidatus Omnitrophota bacterium]MBF0527251.1 hypothetical protein [Deltaproteobacteria bacterium]
MNPEQVLQEIDDAIQVFFKEVQELKKLEKLTHLPKDFQKAYEPLEKLLHDIDTKAKAVSVFNDKYNPVCLQNVVIACAVCFVLACSLIFGAFWIGKSGYLNPKMDAAIELYDGMKEIGVNFGTLEPSTKKLFFSIVNDALEEARKRAKSAPAPAPAKK